MFITKHYTQTYHQNVVFNIIEVDYLMKPYDYTVHGITKLITAVFAVVCLTRAYLKHYVYKCSGCCTQID